MIDLAKEVLDRVQDSDPTHPDLIELCRHAAPDLAAEVVRLSENEAIEQKGRMAEADTVLRLSEELAELRTRITQLEQAVGQIFRHAVRPEAKMDVIESIARTALTHDREEA